MDGSRLDHLTKTLTELRTRRGLSRLLGGLAVGGLLTLLGVDESTAKKKKKALLCHQGQTISVSKKAKKKHLKHGDTLGACPTPTCGKGGPCLVFLSSILSPGNLGGLSGADAKCQGMATAAGLAGTYKAWLSDATSSPASRFVPSTGPYQFVNGTQIAATWTDLTDASPLAATITVTETGGTPGNSSNAWSNTQPNGQVLPFGDPGAEDCVNWSSSSNAIPGGVGNVLNTSTWSAVPVTLACVNDLHLYCFQQS